MRKGQAEASGDAAADSPAVLRPSGGDGVRVLVAEDDAANGFVLQVYLQKLGADVRLASSGTEAWRLLAAERFDLVILDIVLPGMDGLELLTRLRAPAHPQRQVPVLVQTGRVGQEDIVRFRAAGCDACIAKPYRPEDIMGMVVGMLAERGCALSG